MNRIALLVAGCAALALAACDHPDAARQRAENALKTVTKLDCPESQGGLTRVSAAPDGQSCEYKGAQSEVTLRIVPTTDGGPGPALKGLEDELRILVPKAGPADGKLAKAPTGGENVDIKLPGVTIRANDNGANISAGGTDINADEDGAEVRVSRNVETGESKSKDNAVEAMLLLASDTPTPSGWNVAGYQARGPQGGPLVVALIRAKDDEADKKDHDTFEAADKLVRHNVGGRAGKSHIKID